MNFFSISKNKIDYCSLDCNLNVSVINRLFDFEQISKKSELCGTKDLYLRNFIDNRTKYPYLCFVQVINARNDHYMNNIKILMIFSDSFHPCPNILAINLFILFAMCGYFCSLSFENNGLELLNFFLYISFQ